MQTETTMNPPGAAAASAPLAPELESYRAQYEAIREEARSLLEGLTEAQFNWRSEPGRWSIAECLAHLNVAGQMFLPRLDRELKRAREQGLTGRGPFQYGLIGGFLVRSLEPPVKRIKTKAPKAFTPMPEHKLAAVGPAFDNLQAEMLRRVREADGLDLARVKITSPITKLLKLSLAEWFGFIAAHERRHLWQARQVRNHAQFPKA